MAQTSSPSVSLPCLVALIFVALGICSFQIAAAPQRSETGELARQIFAELVTIDTTVESGDTTPAANLLARHLRESGFANSDVAVVGPREKNQNLVVRLHGRGQRRPILLFAHLDVVPALREQWTQDPLSLVERDGYFFGRGAFDVKDEAADLVANLIRLKRDQYRPARDIIIALTSGEESFRDYSGIAWLLANRRDLIDAEYSINLDTGDAHNRNRQHVI